MICHGLREQQWDRRMPIRVGVRDSPRHHAPSAPTVLRTESRKSASKPSGVRKAETGQGMFRMQAGTGQLRPALPRLSASRQEGFRRGAQGRSGGWGRRRRAEAAEVPEGRLREGLPFEGWWYGQPSLTGRAWDPPSRPRPAITIARQGQAFGFHGEHAHQCSSRSTNEGEGVPGPGATNCRLPPTTTHPE